MSVVIVGNTKSGRGLAPRLMTLFSRRLRAAGHTATALTLNDPAYPQNQHFDPDRFRGARALLAFGGDGTVNAITSAAIRTATPVYHIPCGNENLIARRYGMDRKPDTLLRALGTHSVLHTDVGLATAGSLDPRRFLIMASVGPDARVIERLHHTRTKALGHLAYAKPVLKEATRPYLPPITLTADGRTAIDSRRGWLVIANDREYAVGLNFAPKASPTARSLTAVFLPASGLRDCIAWTLKARARRLDSDPRAITIEGTRFEIQIQGQRPAFQIDGEHDEAIAESIAAPSGPTIGISLDRERLPVLIPDPARV